MKIKKFKKQYNVKDSAFKLIASKLGLTASQIRDDHYVLNKNQLFLLEKELRSPALPLSDLTGSATPADSAQSKEPENHFKFKEDVLADVSSKQFSELKYELYLHEDIYDIDQPRIKRRLRWILKNFIIYGKASIIKTCKGHSNEGWLRTPLGGGSNGMQYYLWWAAAGFFSCRCFAEAIIVANIKRFEKVERVIYGIRR